MLSLYVFFFLSLSLSLLYFSGVNVEFLHCFLSGLFAIPGTRESFREFFFKFLKRFSNSFRSIFRTKFREQIHLNHIKKCLTPVLTPLKAQMNHPDPAISSKIDYLLVFWLNSFKAVFMAQRFGGDGTDGPDGPDGTGRMGWTGRKIQLFFFIPTFLFIFQNSF